MTESEVSQIWGVRQQAKMKINVLLYEKNILNFDRNVDYELKTSMNWLNTSRVL